MCMNDLYIGVTTEDSRGRCFLTTLNKVHGASSIQERERTFQASR